MIHNKSGHPVEVKKISIRLWSLRDEIEAAIGRRIKECEAAGVPLFIDDIKKFYNISSSDQNNVVSINDASNDGMVSVMEEVSEESKQDGPKEENSTEAKPEEESKNLNQAEEIIAEQASQGHDTKKPNPILDRPYQRQAPDLEKISYGFILLSDINMETMLSFTKDKFLQGQSVTVEFLIPKNFMMTADVTYCHHYAMRSRIISSTKPDYRIQCKFAFSLMGERDNLRNFLKSIEPNVSGLKNASTTNQDDSLGI